MLPSFLSVIFVGLVWMPGHTASNPFPDEVYVTPQASLMTCWKLEQRFDKAMADRASLSPLADQVAPRWHGECRVYLSGGGKDPI
jgi:hypothetical protein